MRYTKATLLVFGLGLVIGFIVVVGEFSEWERVASALMAVGLAAIPVALFADGHGMTAIRWIAARLSRGTRKPARAPVRRRSPRSTRAVARPQPRRRAAARRGRG